MAVNFEQLEDSPHLLDILVQIEDTLDRLDAYVFRNFDKGEVVEGPTVRRYWVDVTLQYSRKQMPDPRVAARLIKHGLIVNFNKANQDSGFELRDQAYQAGISQTSTVWLVEISVPRRLLIDMNAGELDFYDDGAVDIEEVEDAQDSGVTDETAFIDPQGDDIDDEVGPEIEGTNPSRPDDQETRSPGAAR